MKLTFTKKLTQTAAIGFVMLFVASLFLAPIAISFTPSSEVDTTFTTSLSIAEVFAQEGVDTRSQTGNVDVDQSGESVTMINKIIGFIGSFLLNIGSIVTRLGGMMLEGAIDFLIIDMVRYSPIEAINSVWGVVRDICNLAFVFGFLYLGFQMVFDPHSAEAKRTLSHIIIGALLINFSLFIVKFIIDIGNFLAVSIYNIGFAQMGSSTIPGAIMQVLGITSLFGTADATLAGMTGPGLFGYYFMAFLFLIICGFVFGTAAIMIITRFVTLIMLMMASPILFAGTVFPKTQHYVSDLWHKLIANSLYPAVFLFLIFVSIKVLDILVNVIPGASESKGAALISSDKDDFAAVVIFFCIAMYFLLESLMVAKRISATGGTMAAKMASRTRQVLGNSTIGAAGKFGRITVGKSGHRIMNDNSWNERASKKTLGGLYAKKIRQVAKMAAGATYDARNVVNVNLGDGAEHGYTENQKQVIETRKATAQELGVVDDNDPLVKARKAEMDKADKDLKTENETLTRMKKERTKFQNEMDKLNREHDVAMKKGDKTEMTRLTEEINKVREEKIEPQDAIIKTQAGVVEHKEHDAHEAHEAHNHEKHRRQIGSSYAKLSNNNEASVAAFKATIDHKEHEMKDIWKGYAKLKEEDKKGAREKASKLLKEIKEERKKRDALMLTFKDRGIASLYESATWVDKLITILRGRSIEMEREAAKKIREAAMHGSVVGNPKAKKAKKDDHHDDHGGGHGDDHGKDAHGGGGGHGADHGHAPAAGGHH